MNIEFAPTTENQMTYDDALLYCQFLEYNGHRDWRLSTREEWKAYNKITGWCRLNDLEVNGLIHYRVTPVRDI